MVVCFFFAFVVLQDELSFDEAFRGLLGGLKLLSVSSFHPIIQYNMTMTITSTRFPLLGQDEEASFARARLEKMGKPSEEDFSSLPVLLPEVEGAMGELKGIMAEEALKVARGDEWDELGFRPREWQPFDPVRWLGQRLKRRALEVEGDAE